MSQGPRTGVLLLNLGTPDAPTTPAVRRYLREFLSDPRVIDLHDLPRWLLVNLVIAPFRGPKSAHAYQSVWTAEDSPLLVHGRALEAALTAATGLPVALGMRYGNPSTAAALDRLGDVDEVVVIPLYPQYASATTGSSLEELSRVLGGRQRIPAVRVARPLGQYDAVLDAMVAVAREALADFAPDAVLFSYHGLPESQVRATREGCLAEGCCERPDARLGFCYRAQSLAASRYLADRLGVGHAVTGFQSRLGRQRWIGPYTEDVLRALPQAGVKRLAVLTPSFVADCLETLEEIGDRGAATFREAGGEELRRIPCLNAHPAFVAALAEIVRGAR